MPSLGKFSLRFGICGAVLVYLICDLHFCHGPLSRSLRRMESAPPSAAAVARVCGTTIHRGQLDRAVAERLWSEGKTLAALSPTDRKRIRYAALDDLIDHELLRTKIKLSAFEAAVSDDEIAERLQRFRARFATQAELETALRIQGIPSEQALRDRLAARLQQEKYVEFSIAPQVKVSDVEARQWFEKNQAQLALPERIEARQVFLPTLDRDADAVRQSLVAALASLTDRTKDFGSLARELSEDPTSKDQGGTLGWLTRERLPAELAAPLFALPPNQPTLIRSKMGWHLVEVTGRKPAEPRSFDAAKPEILSALEAIKRRQAITDFRNELRQIETRDITIHREAIEAEP
ncbi:MAG: hypothetical protein RLZZ522_2033 [Verrucomicrobiota bacterium]